MNYRLEFQSDEQPPYGFTFSKQDTILSFYRRLTINPTIIYARVYLCDKIIESYERKTAMYV